MRRRPREEPPLRRWFARQPFAFVGVVLAAASVAALFFALIFDLFTGISSSYAGLILYAGLPLLLAVGLILIGIGRVAARRGPHGPLRWVLDWSEPRDRHALYGVGGVIVFGGFVISVLTHHSFVYMETTAFCANVCHEVMEPQAVAHRLSAHANVACAKCHVAPGGAAFVEAKLGGVRQAWHQIRSDHARPVRMVGGGVDANVVCAQCHDPDRDQGAPLRMFSSFAADETSSRSDTVLAMQVGSPRSGIHRHIGMDLRFQTAADGATIARVEADGAVYALAEGPAATGSSRALQCTDCHNRVGHEIVSFETRLDRALALAELPVETSDLKRRAMQVVGDEDGSVQWEQVEAIRSRLAALPVADPAVSRDTSERISRLYAASYFPMMKVGPQTYPSNIGHDGCFRCHGTLQRFEGSQFGEALDVGCTTCHAMQ